MIQLPSNIRTTLFNASVESKPYQLFSHENDRLLIILYISYDAAGQFALGRSGQDVENSDITYPAFTSPIYIYGTEPLWIGLSTKAGGAPAGMVIVHGIYRA